MSQRRARYMAGDSLRAVEFTTTGTPRAKQSFRYTHGGGYTDPGVKRWQTAVAQDAALAMRDRDKLTGPVKVELEFYLPTKRRVDCDNLAKNVLDGLNGIVFTDDTQVVDLHIVKMTRKPAGVWVRVEELC